MTVVSLCPVPELGGIYSPTNPEVIKKQLFIIKIQ
jgi:hypothetical protein